MNTLSRLFGYLVVVGEEHRVVGHAAAHVHIVCGKLSIVTTPAGQQSYNKVFQRLNFKLAVSI